MMTFTERFTEDEQQLLSSIPLLIGSAMAMADSSGLGTLKEMFTSATSYMGGLKSYPNNEIIRGILPAMENRKEAMEQAKLVRKKTMQRLKDKGIDSPEKIRALVLQDSKDVATLLALKATPEETSEYKEWAMAIAGNVAKAAKEGGFLGFGGERVSEHEKALLADLAEVLGMEPAAGSTA